MKTRQGNLGIKEVEVTEKGVTYKTYRVDGYDLNGNRVRFRSQDLRLAKMKLAEFQTRVWNAEVEHPLHLVRTRLTDAQVRGCEAAVALLDGRAGILEAVKAAIEGRNGFTVKLTPIPLSGAIPAFLTEQKERVRPMQLQVWKSQLGRFQEFAGEINIAEIKTETVSRFILQMRSKDGLSAAAPKTRKNTRTDLHAFFAWCMKSPRNWLSENPATDVTIPTVDRGLIDVLRLTKCRELMMHVASFEGGKTARYHALALFAGIRPGEIGRLDEAKSIDLENGVIHISAAISKTLEPRTVTIQSNLRDWLLKFPAGTLRERNYAVKSVRKQFALSHDVLRHTFISNHVMAFGSFAESAIEAGNSETIIRKNYFKKVSKADAAAFWEIRP